MHTPLPENDLGPPRLKTIVVPIRPLINIQYENPATFYTYN